MPITSLRQPLILLCLVLPIISSCGPPTKENTTTADQQQIQQASTYMDAGNYLAAAEIYQSLAATVKDNRSNLYHLQAAEAFFKGGDITQAETLTKTLKEREIEPPLQTRADILSARIALSNNNASLALDELNFGLPDETTRETLADYYATRAQAHTMNDQPVAALQDRDKLGQFLQTQEKIDANSQEMWELLNGLSRETLTNESFAEQASPRLIGWYDLALIRKTQIYDQSALQTALEDWQEQYPGHPAAVNITRQISELAEKANTLPTQIALLLPFNDAYQEASAAIREGFLAAWYETPGQKPEVRIYDSANAGITEVYQSAVDDGADFIVGPLQKEAVTELIQSVTIEVKTLALNQVEITAPAGTGTTTVPDKLYQFSLSPEDEAIQAAERAWSEGHANALIITADSNWGNRIYEAFTNQWQKLGGQVKESVRIASNLEDYGQPVKQLLNIDKSEERSKHLVATLNRNIVSEPRHRQDADMIFMAVSPVTGRQLVPQLRFYRAEDIPTYSISEIYTGIFNPQANADIDNVRFSDMPWILSPEFEYSPLQQILNRSWEQDESPYRRLYAFGIDAFEIITELGRLQATQASYRGKTGQLTVTANNVIHRSSLWARFEKGTPRLLDQKP